MEKRASQRKTLFHAAAQLADDRLRFVREVDALQHRPGRTLRIGDSVEPGVENEVLVCGEVGVEKTVVGHEAERTAAQLTSRFPAFRLANWNFFNMFQSPEDRREFHDLMSATGLPE